MVSEPIELLGPKSMAVEEKPLIGMQKEQQEMKHTRKLRRLKYSCEEVYERMDNGLCIFCDELDTPGHHDLKHKGIQIFMVDDDLASDDIKEFHQTQETVIEPIVEIGKNLDSFIEPLVHESVSQVLDSVPDVLIVHTVDSHDKEVKESPQKSTSGNGENVAHQLFDQKPERVTSKERHLKHLKGWKFKFKGKNLSRVMPQIGQYKLMERKRKRYNKFSSNIQIEPMGTRIKWEHSRAGKRQRISPFQLRYDTRSYIDVFLPIWLRFETQEKQHMGLSRAERVWKPGELVFLREQWDWRSKVHNCGIIVNIARRLYGTNLSTKLFSPPLTDFQNWKKELGSLTVCSNIGLEEWICGLEIYGCETKMMCVNLANRVWERGELLATHVYWELFGLKALIGLEIYKWKCKQLPIASNFRINHPHELADLVLKRALTEQDTSLPRADWRTKNSVPFVMQGMAVHEMVLMQANETITKTDSGQAHEFQGAIVPNLAPDFVMQLHQIRSSIFQEVHEALWLALPITIANQKKGLHRKNYMIQWSWHCVKHESQQTDFHVWHRWKNKAADLHAVYAISELMMLRLVSFQPNKGDDVVGLVPKATVLREVSHCQSNDYGTIRHKLLLVRDMSSDGYKEDSWSFIWFILKELCSVGFERIIETIKKNFKELSKLDKDHELLSPENLDVHILYLFRKGGSLNLMACHTHLKKLRAALERLPQEVSEELAKRIVIGQKIACGLIHGDVKFHLKHKWRSRLLQTFLRLEVFVENVVLFTSPDKMLFSNNHKLLHPKTGFCTQYNDLELLNTEHQTSPGLDYFTCLNFIWKQVLNCGCEAGHVSSRIFSIGGVHGFEAQRKRLLDLNEISLLDNGNKVDITIKANWFYNKPMIKEVFHLQRPPELIDLQGNPNFITKVLVQWKEHPPDKFFSGSQWQEFNFSSLRTRMF